MNGMMMMGKQATHIKHFLVYNFSDSRRCKFRSI